MDKFIGKILDGRYEILEVIGDGGMAVVYRAKCHNLGRDVAIKILKDEFAKDDEFRRRFHTESQAVAMLSHPNIVHINNVNRSDDVEYIDMELISGVTLKQYLDSKGTITWKSAVFIIYQILQALEHAHERGIIHRDIKSHNIMILPDGTIKVTDFGIARLTKKSNTDSTIQKTLTKEAIGSVHYIAPEQAKGSAIDARADIYSVGVVLYEMLTGRLPFEGDNPVSIAIQHINSLPLSPREHNDQIPETLEKICMHAMCPNLDARYSSATEMLADLDKFRQNPNEKIDYQVISAKDKAVDEKDNRSQTKLKPVIYWLGSILVLILGAFLLISTLLGGFGNTNPDIVVPNFVNMTYENIEDNPMYAGMTIELNSQVIYDDAEKGTVISQEPRADSTIKKNTKIILTLSAGPETVVIPGLNGFDYTQAQLQLTQLGLDSRFEFENSDTVVKDQVIKTIPGPGTTVKLSDKNTEVVVLIVVSRGVETPMVKVPNLDGMTVQNAERLVEALNITLKVETQESDKEEGTIIGQTPQHNAEIEERGVVTVYVSKGRVTEGEPANQGNSDGQTTSSTTSTEKTKNLVIDLSKFPDLPDSFTLSVEIGSNKIYSKTHTPTDGTITVPVKGTGTVTIIIKVDDVQISEQTVNFDA